MARHVLHYAGRRHGHAFAHQACELRVPVRSVADSAAFGDDAMPGHHFALILAQACEQVGSLPNGNAGGGSNGIKRRHAGRRHAADKRQDLGFGAGDRERMHCAHQTRFADLAFKRARTAGDTKADASPPIAAMARTRFAAMWRTPGEADTKTVCTSGAISPFMPAICIS